MVKKKEVAYPRGHLYLLAKKEEVEPDKKEDFGKSKRREIEDENSTGMIALLSLRGNMTGGKDDELRMTASCV
eukprot:2693197-Ditylum_brightwellii.AAC.1